MNDDSRILAKQYKKNRAQKEMYIYNVDFGKLILNGQLKKSERAG